VNGKRETQPRGNCRETSAGRSAEVEGQDLCRSCPIDRCLGSYLSPLASRVRRVDPDPWTKSRLCRKTTRYLVEGEVSDVRGRERYADPDLVESHAEMREWLGEDFDPNAFRRRSAQSQRRRSRQTLRAENCREEAETRLVRSPRRRVTPNRKLIALQNYSNVWNRPVAALRDRLRTCGERQKSAVGATARIAMCCQLRVGKAFLTLGELVRAAMCSTFWCGARDRPP
jgi:hypothetical protein